MPKVSTTSGVSKSKETTDEAFAKRKSNQTKNLKGRNSSDDLNSPGQQVITLTVGSRVEKQGGAAKMETSNDIRVDIPDRQNDQSVAVTEQNKASVVSQNKISSANSSAMQDLGATSQENK